MTKEDVLRLFETDLSDPGSYKSGEYLRDHVMTHAKAILADNRESLIEALRQWIESRSEPRTMVAVSIARRLGLTELREDVTSLKCDVEAGKYFPSFYIGTINRALKALEIVCT